MAVQAIPAVRRVHFPRILREAVLAALLALGLTLPMIGLRTFDGLEGLYIQPQFGTVAIIVAIVFVGRLILAWWWAARADRPSVPQPLRHVGMQVARVVGRWSGVIAAFGVGFAIVLPFLPFADRYVIDLATTVLIYVMLGWGLNIVVGLAGLLDLGYVAFYAVGAYSFALLHLHLGFGFWEALPLAGLLAACFGLILGFPVLRLRGDYLAIVTLGFGEIIRIILINWQSFTNGPNGISGVPRPTFFGLPLTSSAAEGKTFAEFFGLEFSTQHRIVFLYFLILALALLVNLFTLRIRRLPIGRAWEALREDEIACRALGINPTNTKLSAFAIGAMFGGFAGCFFATRQGFISPESFTFIESAIILAIVVLGGMGSQLGVVLAALVLVLLPELGREFAQYRMLFFGAAMVAIMVWRPRGLLAHRDPSIRMHGGRRGGRKTSDEGRLTSDAGSLEARGGA